MIEIRPGGKTNLPGKTIRLRCPLCKVTSTLTLVSNPSGNTQQKRGLTEVIAGYACDSCNAAIPLHWPALGNDGENVQVSDNARSVLRVVEPFDFDHVPEKVVADIVEALDCLSVDAYNGFAAMCRRAIQTICDDLGAEGSTKVEAQLKELKSLASLQDDIYEALKQVMLGGHDGAHPQLPSVDVDRAKLLLELLKDIVFQLYTRPGRIKAAEEARKDAIAAKKDEEAKS